MKLPSQAARYNRADEYAKRNPRRDHATTRDAWLAGYNAALRDGAAVARFENRYTGKAPL